MKPEVTDELINAMNKAAKDVKTVVDGYINDLLCYGLLLAARNVLGTKHPTTIALRKAIKNVERKQP